MLRFTANIEASYGRPVTVRVYGHEQNDSNILVIGEGVAWWWPLIGVYFFICWCWTHFVFTVSSMHVTKEYLVSWFSGLFRTTVNDNVHTESVRVIMLRYYQIYHKEDIHKRQSLYKVL